MHVDCSCRQYFLAHPRTALRHQLKIIMGGAAVDRRYFSIEEPDAFALDAYAGIQICENWTKGMNA